MRHQKMADHTFWVIATIVCFLAMVNYVPCAQGKAVGSAANELEGLEDTVVPLGDENLNLHRVKRVPTPLAEIRGPLARNTRAVPEHLRSEAVYQRMRTMLTLLRILVGRTPHVEIMQFLNWDKTIEIDQLFYTAPTTIFQVRRIVRAASMLGMRVRATGVGHSRSPLYVDEGNVLMDVRHLQRHDGPRMEVHQPTPERNFHTLTAMTGVIEHDLNRFLTEKGLTMLSQPLNDVESFGGMVAAATHGSTWSAPTYSGYVVEMRLMDSAGRLRRFTEERHPDIMKAAKCNLGMFGIMYDITIKVFPTFKAKVLNRFVPMDLIYNATALRETVTSNFLTEISWFPFNSVTDLEAEDYERDGTVPAAWNARRDLLWLRTINEASDEEVAGVEMAPPGYLRSNGSLSGGKAKGLLRGRGALNLIRTLPTESYHYLVNAFPVILPPRWGTETSAAFMVNIDNQFVRPAEALQFMVERAERQIKANGSTPLNALLPRFFHNDHCCLCPGNSQIHMPDDSNRTLVIDFLAPPAQEGFYPAAAEFVEHFKDQKVRPHWAKRHDNIPGIMDIIHSTYGNLISEFTSMRKLARVDPCDMFMNNYLLKIFGRNTDWFCPH
ncbi:L-gulonolactone oxidase-like isoform X2 [Babylonia areolata]|uniref:L-gulonolactone oxidase-like isoform X2 n=1 Tax=Babylonia areolata TaxID=304850 RepID=UPI003FD3E4D7